MPCNTVALVRAKVNASATVELLATADALTALRVGLTAILGQEPVVVYHQVGQEAVLKTDRFMLSIRPGSLQLQAVARLTSRVETAQLTEQVVAWAEKLAIPLATERTVKAIKGRYGQLAVQSDARVGPNRVVRLRIPTRRG